MGKHRIDLAGIGGEVGLGDAPVAVGAGHVGEQLLEIGDVAVHGGAEFRFAFVFALDLVKRRLALQRVEATCMSTRKGISSRRSESAGTFTGTTARRW